jgi:integrase
MDTAFDLFNFTLDTDAAAADGMRLVRPASRPAAAAGVDLPSSLYPRGRLTARYVFETFRIPELRASSAPKDTYYTERYAVQLWERLGFGDKDLRDVRQSDLIAYRAAILDRGGSAVSFDSRWATLRILLRILVVEGHLAQMPPTPRLKKSKPEQRGRPTPGQFCRLLDACAAATWPLRFHWRTTGVSPGTFWRSMYALAYITALRRGDLLRLRWDQITHEGIRYLPQKTRRRLKHVYVPEVRGAIAAAVAPMRGCHPERVFPSGFRGDLVAEQQRRIAACAGVPGRLATLQAFRRLSLDSWLSADERAPGLISGHGLRSSLPTVTRTSYISPEAEQARVDAILRDAAMRFPLPAAIEAMRPVSEQVG